MPDQLPPGPKPRLGRHPSPAFARVDIRDFDEVRFTVTEAREALTALADRILLPRSRWSREEFNILAVSGGAAGGAFGAGLLVGLTRAGRRPDFSIVTGVSTGALIAPFAFLGPDWDDRLTEAYTGGHAARTLTLRRVGAALFGQGALEALIYPFVDEAMIEAVALNHARGRRLLVATTDLDRQRICIWDMGAIASRGGPAALALFRDVLVASASLPGIFPPKLIPGDSDGKRYDEMHVDGGVSAPLFIMPDPLLRWDRLGQRLRNGRVYAIVNTLLDPEPQTTPNNPVSVLVRSFDTLLRYSYRQALSTTATFCAAARLPLNVASIPPDPANGSMMRFDTASMRRMFDAAAARGPDLWVSPPREPSILGNLTPWPRPSGRG